MSLPRVPDSDEAALHVHSSAGQIGPISRVELLAKVESGEVPDTSNLWMEGMDGWVKLSDHREILLDGLVDHSADDAPRQEGESEDDYLDRVFGELVHESWAYLAKHRFASHIDEVFVGAIITSTLDVGYSLIDLTSDGVRHYMRFENLDDKSRIVVRMTHMTGSLAVSRVLGHRASVVIGYGEKVGNMTKIWGAIRAEMKSSYLDPEPGTITVDGDVNSGYVYCQVDLTLDIDDYVSTDYAVDYPRLSSHVGATTHALRKYLRGRFT